MKLINMVKVNFVLFALLVLSGLSYSQNVYDGFLQDFFLGRQPSTKAEAMGRGLVACPEYDFSSWYNPATLGLSDLVTANISYMDHSYVRNADYFNLSVTYNAGKYGAFGLNRYQNNMGIILAGDEMKATLYTLNYANQFIKNFYAGVNFSILDAHMPANDGSSGLYQTLFTMDLGLLKVFQIQNTQSTTQKLSIGTAFYNLLNPKYTAADPNQPEPLPVTFKLGACYNIQYSKISKPFELKTLDFLVYAEVEDLLNTKYNTAIKTGCEVDLYEFVSVRLGYYTQNINDYGISTNRSTQSQFTYGFGIELPLTKLAKGQIPLSFRLDYANLKPPLFYDNQTVASFNSVSFSMRWANL